MSAANLEFERLLMRIIKQFFSHSGKPFLVIYTAHPVLSLAEVRKHPFFAKDWIVVHDNTIFSWFVSDASVSTYSSTLFESKYFGVDAFTPFTSADRIYSPKLLEELWHPSLSESVSESLQDFLLANTRLKACSVLERAKSRLSDKGPDLSINQDSYKQSWK